MAVMHLRLIVPSDRSERVLDTLVADPRVTSVVRLPGVAHRPEGDMIECDVTREATSDILTWLKEQGLYDEGAVALADAGATPSVNARQAEQAAPGAPDDAVIWDAVVDQARNEASGSWVYYAFLTLATMIAAVAVVTDSSILVVGAMVVGPEFGVVAALAVGIALRNLGLTWRSARGIVEV